MFIVESVITVHSVIIAALFYPLLSLPVKIFSETVFCSERK